MDRSLCIHGHFYQPPRESPWLETIELQESAHPYHDWNERITAECYAPNAASRILDGEGRIRRIVNNYSMISFNFGPTLLAWMKHHAPETYAAVLEADRVSQERFSGHGAALAQAYNHMIMPLANRRDKQTQIRWGMRDFEHRFGRRPEGLWLPETAADTESLYLLAQAGIRFTILAPRQALRVRKRGARSWQDVSGERVDPKRSYEVRLGSRRKLALFFYDGPVSRAIAFEGLLRDGGRFAERLLSGFDDASNGPMLMHVATDGETYGHHHRHGDMALAYALDHIDSEAPARLTNYAEFLEQQPPEYQVEIQEESSWSCVHGVERWRADCGCNTGMNPGWGQQWRQPLRESLDWLRDELATLYEQTAARLLGNPWAARDDYIEVILDRSPDRVADFMSRHAVGTVSDAQRSEVLQLLELQRHAMLMYTSCGWFFDDISGIETMQVLEYAGRAVQLARQVCGRDLEPALLDRLEAAASNVAEHGDGRQVYQKQVKPAMVDLLKVGAHYAVSSPFQTYAEKSRVYCYNVDREDYRIFEAGRARLALGRARVASVITEEALPFTFGVLHLGDHNVNAGVRDFAGEAAYESMLEDVSAAFAAGDVAETIRSLDRHFGKSAYSLRSLFRAEQKRILGTILQSAQETAEQVYKRPDGHAGIMRYLAELGLPSPRAFRAGAEVVLNAELRRAFEAEEPDLDRIEALLGEAPAAGVSLEVPYLALPAQWAVERIMDRVVARPLDGVLLSRLRSAVELVARLPFEVDLWRVENRFYSLSQEVCPKLRQNGDASAEEWLEAYRALGRSLRVRIG